MSNGRLGIYNDGPFSLVQTSDGARLAPDAADLPFMTFASEVGSWFDTLVVFGRRAQTTNARPGVLSAGVQLEPLPYYENLRDIGDVLRAAPGTLAGFWRGLSRVDVVWIFGPHPFAFLLFCLAVLRRKGVVLGVRQDSAEYFRHRLPDGAPRPMLWLVQAWDAAFRRLSRVTRTTVVGGALAQRYGGPRAQPHVMTVSLVRRADVVADAPERDWGDTIGLLSVGRIDSEKNPILLVDALAELNRRRPGRYRLAWIGTGPLEAAVRRRARELGIDGLIEWRGFVPFGPDLLAAYRNAHVFVHVSLTEGVPAVLVEALASGLPVVATAVGGVPTALEFGRAGLLVPPSDPNALVEALLDVVDDAAKREASVRHGLKIVQDLTLEAEAERVASFIRSEARPQ